MDSKILFSESQKFRQWWMYLITLGLTAFTTYGVIRQVFFHDPFDNILMGNSISNSALWGSWITSVVITLLVLNVRLQTQIKSEGIDVRFFPFQFGYKHYGWDKMSECYVRKYSPLGEFGGWGYRFSANGKAFNMSGNMGLQLVFTNNKRLLIGTQQPLEMDKILTDLGRNKAVS